jgi:DNA-binding CsgD family transcriptional regulator/DNA-binding transcriptional ArsR family regulator
LLAQLGFSPVEEVVYEALVDVPALSATELSARTGTTPDALGDALDRLRSAGLVDELPGLPRRYCAVEPDVVLAPLVAAQTRRLEKARAAAGDLVERFRAARPGRHPRESIEVVVDAGERSERLEYLEKLARAELRVIDKPPDAAAQCRASDGVRVRSIYDRTSLDVSGFTDRILGTAAGSYGQARVIAEAPFRLRLADDQLAMVFLAGASAMVGRALVVHPSPLLDAMVSLFETLWRYAIPLPSYDPAGAGPDSDGPSVDEARLVALMAAGMTDAAVARHLGLSLRTVQRQVRALMGRLGTRTRFQAGLQAHARGWI